MTVDVYWISEYRAIMLNSEKLVAKPPRHSLMSSIIAVMLGIFEVNGEEIEASA